MEIPNKKEANSSKSSTEQESHILVVILGSLAGVLLVISLALIGLCIWYHLRTKRLVYQGTSNECNLLRQSVNHSITHEKNNGANFQ